MRTGAHMLAAKARLHARDALCDGKGSGVSARGGSGIGAGWRVASAPYGTRCIKRTSKRTLRTARKARVVSRHAKGRQARAVGARAARRSLVPLDDGLCRERVGVSATRGPWADRAKAWARDSRPRSGRRAGRRSSLRWGEGRRVSARVRGRSGFERRPLTPVLGRLEDEVVERVADLGLSVARERREQRGCGRVVRAPLLTFCPAYASGKSANARKGT